ncbi:MAG TPA: hypothetical protein VGL81_09080 [Polyangiaceae bacterium]
MNARIDDLTDRQRTSVVKAIRAGRSVREAAADLGISPAPVRRALREDATLSRAVAAAREERRQELAEAAKARHAAKERERRAAKPKPPKPAKAPKVAAVRPPRDLRGPYSAEAMRAAVGAAAVVAKDLLAASSKEVRRLPHPDVYGQLRALVHGPASAPDRDAAVLALLAEVEARAVREAACGMNYAGVDRAAAGGEGS